MPVPQLPEAGAAPTLLDPACMPLLGPVAICLLTSSLTNNPAAPYKEGCWGKELPGSCSMDLTWACKELLDSPPPLP